MIYSKKASFPHPIYSDSSNSYLDPSFTIDIDLNDLYNEYLFKGTYEIESEYIKNLIKEQRVKVYFIVQSKDNKFYEVTDKQFEIHIPKSRISLSKRTSIQLLIMAKEDLSLSNNMELDEFYSARRKTIVIPTNSLVALSNVIYFDGDIKYPYELFEKKYDPEMKEAIRYELSEETIVISFKKEHYQFQSMNNKKILNYPYIYTGLQKALTAMIRDEAEKGNDFIDIKDHPKPTGLYLKLFNLMESKNIEDLNYENIDEVIHYITDGLIDKYVNVVIGMDSDGN